MDRDLEGKTIVITGASSGIGRAAAVTLAGRGARVAVVGRNPERTAEVADRIGADAFLVDYDRLDDVRRLATELLERYPRIDVLANNAGGLVPKRAMTADGHERTFQHNHLAPFLLTALLLGRLTASDGRVISTSSAASRLGRVRLDDLDWQHRLWAGGWPAYGTSKLETIMFVRELARRNAGLSAYSFHPGVVATNFGSESGLMRLGKVFSPKGFGIAPDQGAAPLIHLAATADLGVPSGGYFDGLDPNGRTRRQAEDAELAARLWERSAELVAA